MKSMKFVDISELFDPIRNIKFQIWARTLDLIPTEPPVGINVGWRDKEGVYTKYNNALDYFDKFLVEDNKQFREPFKVRPSGIIVNGNYRYHWARWGNKEFVPIDFDHLINKKGSSRDRPVIKRPIQSVSRPMGDWEWTQEAGYQYPESLIQEGHNPEINMSIEQVMDWMNRNV
jgi:hypothetical protein